MKINKNYKGITLIALVVTIVVLLILAGVSIAMLTGENGVITQAQKAHIENNHSSILETMRLEAQNFNTDKITGDTSTDVLSFLKEEGKIDDNNVVNVKNSLQTTLTTGNGTGKSDVYIIEKNNDGEYDLIYYDKNETPRDLGFLTKDKVDSTDSSYFDITDDGVISIKREYGYYIYSGTSKGMWDNWTAEELTIPSEVNGIKVKEIAGYFLGQNKKIKKINISNGIEKIGSCAFTDCINLESVTIPDSITYIGSWAFDDCGTLTSITIPKNLTGIGYASFERCIKLKTINYKGTKEEWGKIDKSIGDDYDALQDATIVYDYKE